MQQLELDDIQGIILHGYGSLNDSYFCMLSVEDVAAAKSWLTSMANEVRNSDARPYDPVCNLAFTYPGLQKLGLDEHILTQFSREFQEGMTASHRSRTLGDHGPNAPENWTWGSPNSDEAHILLLLYAVDKPQLDAFYDSQQQRFSAGGLREVNRLHGLTLNGRKEHFGFRDGIAQPLVEGLNKPGARSNRVKAGEFLLGYANEYDQYPESPLIAPSMDGQSLLRNAANMPQLRDFGRNGSYLVFRQMRQHVQEFWRFLDDSTKAGNNAGGVDASVELASKMVGRWPSGAPLMNSPNQDDPALQDDDSFLYHHADQFGLKCPVGSHIRRTNPRDTLDPDPGSQKSIDIGNRHRIIRRGRAYGKPIADSMNPGDILNGTDDGEERGLHFLCFNTNLGRQFEFIQQTWANSKKFAGLYDDADPIIGDHDPNDTGATSRFIIQAKPVRKSVTGLTSFVNIKGGAYFFMPGIRAIRYLVS